MAKNSTANDAARLKAQQMREAQAKADKRVRNIIIGVVAVIVIAIVAVVGVVVSQQVAKENAARSADSAVLGSYKDGAGVIVTANGVSKEADESLPTLTEYFDYSCHACADIDGFIGQDVTDGALNGEYNLEIIPVDTVNMPYAGAATSASLIVAEKDPNNWIKFHHALLSYFASQFNSGKGSVIQDADASWKQVKTIAAEQGIAQDLIETFPVNAADEYLEITGKAWREAKYQNRDANGSIGTPEFVLNHTSKIALAGNDAASILESLRSGMKLESAESGTQVSQSQ
ncbi:DsbA family protein [Schaalia vaccimaxillae]|uniref:DsbA family protein n=1 Tax=Schaalia vaccimaxillae TaxID=183916 RepID=UPI0003B44F5F|nr:thioredoxin [Schaalia vaccimaxillae]